MNSRTTRAFRRLLGQLPAHVRRQAREAYLHFRDDPNHPGLHFKPVGGGLYSARVGRSYRAVAFIQGSDIVWFWIGTHAEYDRLLRG